MAEKSVSREPESGWVLAGTEGLAVETVGPEQPSGSAGAEDEEPEGEEEEEEEEGEEGTEEADADTGRGLGLTPELDPPPAEPEEDRDPSTGAEGPSEPPPEPDTPAGGEKEEPQSDAQRGPCPDTPKAVPPAEDRSGTSSDDEVEGKGLRRRLGQEPRAVPPRPVPPQCRGTPDTGDEEGLSMSRYLLGALVLVAVGLLIVSGGIYDPADGPVETVGSREVPEPLLPADANDSQQKPPAADPQEPRSLQSVSLLLDRLAKENQEIRLMQAELQAHKEELQALLHRSEGEAAAAGLQRQSLAAENSRLQAALERESAALRDARAELQRLRGAGPPEQPAGGAEGGAWHPGRLASLRRELAGALQRAKAPGAGLEGLLEELSGLEQRLGRELDAARPWKKPFKGDKKEGRKHKRPPGDAGTPYPERREQLKHPHGRDPRPPKPGKSWGNPPPPAPPQRSPYRLPPLSRYRAPRGCSGVTACAHKEGREVLGVALEPVQKAQFLRLLGGFMEEQGWGRHFGGVAEGLEGLFGADGTFSHDRLRFVDLLDDLEELLEDVARLDGGGNRKAADGFEEFVLRHYAGERGKEKEPRAQRHHGG